MSYATDNPIAPPAAMARPVGLIAGIAALQVLAFSVTDYSAFGGRAVAVPWMLLDAYLLRRLWFGSSGAWTALVLLDIAVLAMVACTLADTGLHVEAGPWPVARLAAELALLAAPAMRRWTAEA
jgi:hypothetical protein